MLEVKSSKSQARGCPRDMSLQGHPAQSSGFGGRSQKAPILQLFFEPDSGLEGVLVSCIQKSIKDTMNNFLDE